MAMLLSLLVAALLFTSASSSPSLTTVQTIHVPAGDSLQKFLCNQSLIKPNTTFQLASGEHTISKLCTIDGVSGLTIVGTTGVPNEQSVITGSYSIPRSAWVPPHSNSQKKFWTANIPAGTWGQGSHPPQQFWIEGTTPMSSQIKARRIRARHPNLMKSDGVSVNEAPYLFWQAEMCPLHQPMMSRCSPQYNCNAKGCNTSFCEACVTLDKYGLRYNNTADGDLFTALEAEMANHTTTSDVQAVVYHGWTASRHFVNTIFTPGHSLHFSNPSDRPIGYWSGLTSEGGQRYYIENSELLLDSPGEWFLRDGGDGGGVLLYIPIAGEDMTMIDAKLPLIANVFVVTNSVGVDVENVTIAHSDWRCGGANRTETCDHQSAFFQTGAAVTMYNSSFVSFTNVQLLHHGNQALWVNANCSDIQFSRGIIADLGTGAIRIGSSPDRTRGPGDVTAMVQRVTISDSVLSDGGWVFPSGTAVLVTAGVSHTRIIHNDISEFSYTALSLGWNWNFLPQLETGSHEVRNNHIHHLGYPRRETGDAMACIYTLGQLNNTVVDGNVCHDVRAYMSGGYCLSQDQGSSNIVFTNNVCLRTTGSPHNTHYGMNLTYENNIFWGGYWDSWVETNAAGALRTSPQNSPCANYVVANGCPDRIQFTRNLIGQWDNFSAPIFEGNFNDSSSSAEGAYRFSFSDNFYWSDIATMDLKTAPVFGGESARVNHLHPRQLSWFEWQSLHNGTQDQGGVLGTTHPFASDSWATTLNVSLSDTSAAKQIGWHPIDTSTAGPRPLKPTMQKTSGRKKVNTIFPTE